MGGGCLTLAFTFGPRIVKTGQDLHLLIKRLTRFLLAFMSGQYFCSMFRDGILRECKLAEEIWQIVEGFVEYPANLKAQLKIYGSVPKH